MTPSFKYILSAQLLAVPFFFQQATENSSPATFIPPLSPKEKGQRKQETRALFYSIILPKASLTLTPSHGYDYIKILGGRQHKVMNNPDPFDERLLCENGTYYYPFLDSTNAEGDRLAKKGAPAYTAVLADTQSAGRGRRGRAWHSPPGKGIYFSVLLRPPAVNPAAVAPVTLVAAVAVALQLRESTAIPVSIKWPNDLLVGTKKLGGILTESRREADGTLCLVLGIGLNVNHRTEDFPVGLRNNATSLYLESGLAFKRSPLFLAVLNRVRQSCRLFFETGFAPFQPLWKEFSSTLGTKVELSCSKGVLQGKAVDLEPEGALLIEDSRGQRYRIFCGEII